MTSRRLHVRAPRRAARAVAPALLAALALAAASDAAGTDPTPPVITASVTGALGLNGWHVGNTTVSWTATDPESGISETSGCDTRTVRDETIGVAITCRATNGFGLTGSYTVTIRLDRTPPTVRPRPERPPDGNGWFNHRIGFVAAGSDAFSGIASCDSIPAYRGPDRRRFTVTARCSDRAGHRASGSRTFRYDATPPKIRAVPGRPPDRYGWYARNVRISFAGSDALSRLDRCSSTVYRGPSTPRAAVAGWCRDRAGNRAFRTHRFRFAKPLLLPASGSRLSEPPLLDWVDVPRAVGYNVQLWRDGRKILSRWPAASRLQLDRSWRFEGASRRLLRGEQYTWYVWPRFPGRYGSRLGRSGFAFAAARPATE